MNTILECTPKGQIKHEMPEFIFEAIRNALNMRIVRNVASAIAIMPEELRNRITSTPVPPRPPEPPKPSFVFYDELATDDELKRATEWYQKQYGLYEKNMAKFTAQTSIPPPAALTDLSSSPGHSGSA